MIKYYCNCCNMEAKQLYPLSYLCHINTMHLVPDYVDDDGNRVSGKMLTIELCIKCYNVIVPKSVYEFKKLKKS